MPVAPGVRNFLGNKILKLQAYTKTDIFSALRNIKLWNKNWLKENKILY
jgi:hypothetical protein